MPKKKQKTYEHPTLRWPSGRAVRYRSLADRKADRRLCDRHRSDGSGVLCRHYAGRGPGPLGDGWLDFCFKHGGASLKGLGHPAVVPGKKTRSKYIFAKGSRLERLVDADDPAPESVDADLRLARGLIRMLVEDLEEHDTPAWRQEVIATIERMQGFHGKEHHASRAAFERAFDELADLARTGARAIEAAAEIRRQQRVIARMADTKTRQAARRGLDPEAAEFFVQSVAMIAAEIVTVGIEKRWRPAKARSAISTELRSLMDKMAPAESGRDAGEESIN